ncbi:MAG: type II toxin-antitoxin system VapB family antitoxin [Kiritimatiellia bacterium]
MRLTLNIDGDLLERVMKSTGSKTKTAAIQYALEEIDRRYRLHELLRKGSGVPTDELPDMFDPASIADHLQVAEPEIEYGTSQP